MKVIQRGYTGQADVQAMAALGRDFPASNVHVIDLPYRLSSWALDDPGNIGLWFGDGDQLLAWAVLQTPFWAIDFAFHPEAGPDLHRRLWAWADQRAKEMRGTPYGRPAWFINVFADEVETIHMLEQAGFACQADVGEDSWSKVLLRRPADLAYAESALPAGFTFRPLAGDSEVDAYVELHRAVFESRNMTVEWRSRTIHQPEYITDLDLVAVDAEGRLAAFCVGWLSQDKSGGISSQIEPMGVHADYRQSGLGRAILSENLRRMRLHGARQIFVETDSYRDPALALYEAVGFRVFKEIRVFRKDYKSGYISGRETNLVTCLQKTIGAIKNNNRNQSS